LIMTHYKMNLIVLDFFLIIMIVSCSNPSTPQSKNKVLEVKEVISEEDYGVNSQGDKLKRCDVQSVADIKVGIRADNMDRDKVYKFIFTFDRSCANNVEYSQFSNRMLFLVLERYTSLTMQVISENNQLNKDYIFDVLKRPINDGIDTNKIYELVKEVEIDGIVKDRVLESLLIASKRHD